MVLFQLPHSGTNVIVLQLSLGLSVLSCMLKHQADLVSFFSPLIWTTAIAHPLPSSCTDEAVSNQVPGVLQQHLG